MDDVEALRTLTERLAARITGWDPVGTPGQPPPEILAAAVPNDLPASIPLPDDLTMIGSIRHRRTEPSPAQLIHLLFDTSLTAQQVRAFYQDHLAQAGWSQAESAAPMGGFAPASSIMSFETNTVQGASGIHLTLDIYPSGETAQVFMAAVVHPAGSPWIAMRSAQRLHHKLQFPQNLLPTLQLPPSAISIHGGGAGSTISRVESAMEVETDLDRAALAAFFTPQLAQAGWTRQDEGQDGVLTWTTWAFEDEGGAPWRGVLYVLERPDHAHRYRLSLVGEWPGQQV